MEWIPQMLPLPDQYMKAPASATPEVMDASFHQVDKLHEKTDLTSLPINELQHYIWNCDETGFCTSAAVSKILANHG